MVSQLLKSASLATLMLASSQLLAATLQLPEELIALQVDDNPVASSIFNKVESLELSPGSHMLKLKYEDLYETGFDDHRVIESDPFWLQVEIGEQSNYSLVFERAKSVEGALAFARSPEVKLAAQGGTPTVLTPAVKPKSKPVAAISATKAPAGPDASAMLEYWWQKATPAQKAAFLEKIKGG